MKRYLLAALKKDLQQKIILLTGPRQCDGEEFDLNYIRNKDGQEIDFLVSRQSQPHKLIEVKWKDSSLSPNFKKFLVNEPMSRIQLVGEITQNKSFPGGERIESAVDYLAGISIT